MFIDDIEINDMHIRIAEILLDIIHSRQENIITYKELSIKLDREVYEEQLGDIWELCLIVASNLVCHKFQQWL